MEARLNSPEVTAARPDDFGGLTQLFYRANEYAKLKSGTYAWHDVQGVLDNIWLHLGKGDLFVTRKDSAPSAMVIVNEDAGVWGAAQHVDDDDALYITKFMRDPEIGSGEEAKRLLEFVAQVTLDSHKSYIRCDIVDYQPGILDYYTNLGFSEKGKFSYKSGKGGILMEAQAQTVLESVRKS